MTDNKQEPNWVYFDPKVVVTPTAPLDPISQALLPYVIKAIDFVIKDFNS